MTWGSYQGWIWLAVESHLAVICASAPALKIIAKITFGGSGWNSLQDRSERQKHGYSATSNTNSSAVRKPDQAKGKAVTTKSSTDFQRQDSDDESIGLPVQDVELVYIDPEENHVRNIRAS